MVKGERRSYGFNSKGGKQRGCSILARNRKKKRETRKGRPEGLEQDRVSRRRSPGAQEITAAWSAGIT